MLYFLAILFGIGVIWAFWFLNTRSDRKKTEPTETAFDYSEKPEGNQSLDIIFAYANDMWVCRRCETLNKKECWRCAACGAPKQKQE